MAIITLKNDALTVKISTMGAELQSVCDANGVERIFDPIPPGGSSTRPCFSR